MSAWRWFVPGRIEVLGKHTDYAGGPSLLCAAERGFHVSAVPRADHKVCVTDEKDGRSIELPLSPEIEIPAGWGNYVAAVVRRIARNFPGADRGIDIAIRSDLPKSAGLSSSSALMIAIFTAIAEANRLPDRSEFPGGDDLAGYLASIENGQSYGALAGDRGVGTFGGSEDHIAILCSRAGQLSQYRFAPPRLERCVAMPENWKFVIGSSGVKASKTGAARDRYNHASRLAGAVLESWNEGSKRADVSLDRAVQCAEADEIRNVLRTSKHRDFAPAELIRRFDHFAIERELVPAATAAFDAADGVALGETADRSQAAAEELLCNQVPETIALARGARELGAIAASAFGAGFGGSVWALVPASDAEEFLQQWRSGYASRHPVAAAGSQFFTSAAGPPLLSLDPT